MLTSSSNVNVRYDEFHDVLYINLTAPRPSVGEFADTCDSVVYKYAMDNDELIGVVIMSFSRLDRNRIQPLIPFPIDLGNIQH